MGDIQRRSQGLLSQVLMTGRRAWRRARTSPLFDPIALAGPHPLRLVAVPPDPWPGDPAVGAALLGGRFVHGGQTLTNRDHHDLWQPGDLWAARGLSPGWLRWLHGFSWLRDLAVAADRGGAERLIQAHMREWLAHYSMRTLPAWEPAVLARRLMAWFAYAPLILARDDGTFRSLVLTSMARQARHLARSWTDTEAGPDRVRAAVGFCFAGLFLPESNHKKRGLQALEETVSNLILADGGMVTRSPMDIYMAFRDLASLEAALTALDETPPPLVVLALDRMAPMLKALTLGDRRLVQFNGTSADGTAVLDDLDGPFASMKPIENASHTGFQRLERGRMVVVMDCGPPAPRLLSRHHHAGTLGFEMSLGPERVVVNCGSLRSLPDPAALELPGLPAETLAMLVRGTAAHSTLVLNDTNSAAVLRHGLIGEAPRQVSYRRKEADGAIFVEARHDGYDDRFGLDHRRRLYLSDDGTDLRGEDSLIALRPRRRPLKFDIRFHLHPDVTVRELNRNQSYLLRLPSGHSLRFLARGGSVSLDDSLYLGLPSAPRSSRQLVVNGNVQADETTISWAFRINP